MEMVFVNFFMVIDQQGTGSFIYVVNLTPADECTNKKLDNFYIK